LINHPALSSILLKVFSSGILVDEAPIQEIHLINLTNWGWLLFISIVIVIVWLLIIFQVKSFGSHELGLISKSESDHNQADHDSSDAALDLPEPNDE
jgi:hypothetical protein